MKTFVGFLGESANANKSEPLVETVSTSTIRTATMALLLKVSGLNNQIHSDRSATTAQKRLSSEIGAVSALLGIAIYTITGDPNPTAAARRFTG